MLRVGVSCWQGHILYQVHITWCCVVVSPNGGVVRKLGRAVYASVASSAASTAGHRHARSPWHRSGDYQHGEVNTARVTVPVSRRRGNRRVQGYTSVLKGVDCQGGYRFYIRRGSCCNPRFYSVLRYDTPVCAFADGNKSHLQRTKNTTPLKPFRDSQGKKKQPEST